MWIPPIRLRDIPRILWEALWLRPVAIAPKKVCCPRCGLEIDLEVNMKG